MPNQKQQNLDDLCPAGKLLEVRLQASTDNLLRATKSLEKTCKEISETMQQLSGYAIRDKERIEVLEKSRDCKSEKIKDIQETVQTLEISFGTHLGEHKATEKVKSRLALGGLASGPATLGIFEMLKLLITGKW